MQNSLHQMRLLDELARRPNSINNLHPLTKLLTTLAYLVVVVSFGRYEISALLPLVFYPVILLAFTDLPIGEIMKRIGWTLPFIIGLGMFNPIFDHQTVSVLGFSISQGWLTFLSIFIKCVLTVAAGVLLIATTGMDKLGSALRMLRVPKIFVLQLLLTYRYISVLGNELARMLRAYSLRAPGHKGIKREAWGSFTGNLLLRSFDRAQRVYAAMCLRGFSGDYHAGRMNPPERREMIFILGWLAFFIAARIYDLPAWLGSLLTGVIS